MGARKYPKLRSVMDQFVKQYQASPLTLSVNEDGDISHPAVTQWYVDKFCRDNHLVR
jgi:hypothetical protein